MRFILEVIVNKLPDDNNISLLLTRAFGEYRLK